MRRLLLVLAVLAAATLPACTGSAAAPACDTPTATTQVELRDFAYGPVCVEASAGDTLTISNTGGAPHTYTVSDTSVNVNLDAGETGEAALEGIPAGTYAVHCTYHPQMAGALKVV